MSLDLDMKEIHEIFFEESLEGIDVMESGLLGLSPGETNLEIINDIFRAAHSIKGGAATFGFLEISNFTHGVETLLDQMRTGERPVTEEAIEIFLKSVDCISDMLSALREERPIDTEAADGVQSRIEAMLSQEPGGSGATEEVAATENKADCGRVLWKISFKPDPGLLQSGNEPSRIFRELSKLGDLSVRSKLAEDVGFEDIDPTHCYTAWELELISDVSRSELEELFEWVVDQCELKIEMQELEAADVTVATKPSSSPQPVQSAAGSTIQVDLPNASDLPGASKKSPVAAVPASKDAGSIRVSIEKIDCLLNLVGELVITQSMLG
ncbi:MAG: Hpt domain-containing protein, partial [Spongiibacteraceae bacterium]